MLQIDLKKWIKDMCYDEYIDVIADLILEGVDITTVPEEMIVEEIEKRMSIKIVKIFSNPNICKEIDRNNNSIKQKNFLVQKSFKKNNKRKKK